MFTLPAYFGIAALAFLAYRPLLDDFEKCSGAIRSNSGRLDGAISKSLIRALVVAEDHRNAMHFGVDQLAILRCVKVWLVRGERQGASTIEQQLVRTITGRYERSLRRKLREQILAVMLNSRFNKSEMASCYLNLAYYGAALVGASGVYYLQNIGEECSDAVIVAHLKYPRALVYDGVLAAKHLNRVKYVTRLLAEDSTCGVFIRPFRGLSKVHN